MLYKKGEVGNNYGWALVSDRALQSHIGKDDGEAVMFLAAMTCEEVLPITLPVPQPLTVTAFLFEFWIMFCVIPAMLARGKDTIVLDNAKVHRRPARYTLVVRISNLLSPNVFPVVCATRKNFLDDTLKSATRQSLSWSDALSGTYSI